jgi:hypothetical protein
MNNVSGLWSPVWHISWQQFRKTFSWGKWMERKSWGRRCCGLDTEGPWKLKMRALAPPLESSQQMLNSHPNLGHPKNNDYRSQKAGTGSRISMAVLLIQYVLLVLFCFCGTGAWTQGLHHEPLYHPSFCEGFFWHRVSQNCLPRLASNHNPPDLCLLSS